MLRDVRISPTGNRIAFLETDPKAEVDYFSVTVMDVNGKRQRLPGGWTFAWGLAWSHSGEEIWIAASKKTLSPKELYCVSLSGRERLMLRLTGELFLEDISMDGRILMTVSDDRSEISVLPPGETGERDLSWLDYSVAIDISKDGKTLLTDELGEGTGGDKHIVYLRNTDGTPAVRLGEGTPLGFSQDEKWVLANTFFRKKLILIPTRAGEVKALPPGAIVDYGAAALLPDGKRIVFQGREEAQPFRIYVQDVDEAETRAITPARFRLPMHAVSPDGKMIVVIGPDQRFWLYPVEEGKPRLIPGVDLRENLVCGWNADGRAIYITMGKRYPVDIHLLDISTGRKKLWRQLSPYDAAGVIFVFNPQYFFPSITPDGKSYAYSYLRILSDLYVVDGLK